MLIKTIEQASSRWRELLVEFNFMLKYHPGSNNHVADAKVDLATIYLMIAFSRSKVTISQELNTATFGKISGNTTFSRYHQIEQGSSILASGIR